MARRNPPPRPPRVVRRGAVAVAVVFASGLTSGVIVALGGPLGPPIARAEPAPDLARARELYRSAEAAMKDGRYDDAARDYGSAYELSADPALFYKIGHASERAGKCDVALIYYARYLREGKPTEQFTALTRARIAACGGDRAGSSSGAGSAGAAGAGAAGAAPGPGDASGPSGGAAPAAGTSAGSATGAIPKPAEAARGGTASAGPASGAGPGNAGRRASTGAVGGPASGARPGRAGDTAASSGAAGAEGGAASPEAPASAGPAVGPGATDAALIPPTREKIAWLMGGGAIALVTLGGVLAYAASSSENDVRDLYAGFAGQSPMFDARTRKRYDDLVDEGRRYQHLSWAAFGLAGAAAVGVAVLFAVGRGGEPAPPRAPTVTPVVGPRGAGVSVRF